MGNRNLSSKARWIDRAARLGVMLLLGQALFFKLTGAPEAVALFQSLGTEPWGRFATGGLELLAVLLIALPATAAWGGLLGTGLMGGAVLTHLFFLGIDVGGDGGALFGMGLAGLVLSAVVLYGRRCRIPLLGGAACRALRNASGS